MAKEEELSLSELKAPLPFDQVKKVQDDAGYDCLPCRISGSLAFIGLGAYTLHSGMNQLKQQERKILRSGSRFGLGARKAATVGTAVMLMGMGVYRQFN